MNKEEALAMIDEHTHGMTDVIELLHWAWLRVIVAHLTKEEWERALERALPVLMQ